LFFQSIHFFDQRLSFLAVFLLIGLADLVTQIVNLAIGLELSFIATDEADNLLCICLQLGHVRLLSVRVQQCHGKNHKRDDQQPLHIRDFPSNSRATAPIRLGSLC
jgi:hypothetical protein